MTYDPEIDVRRLRLAPGDVVIVSVPANFSSEMATRVAEGLRRSMVAAGHADVPVALASNEVGVSVLGPNEPGALSTTGGGAPRHNR